MKDPFFLNWLTRSPSISSLEAKSGPVTLNYYVYGKNPRLFMSSGMHGDERGVIRSVSKAIQTNLLKLPSFLYVPIINPSGVLKKTRKNSNGQDVNRSFLNGGTSDEAKAMMKIIGQNKFSLSVSFHEDWEFTNQFYMYDELTENENRDISQSLTLFKEKITKMGVKLFNGIDDPRDPALKNKFTDGYQAFKHLKEHKETGQFESWMIRNGKCSRCFTPEIPKDLIQEKKDKIVKEFFTCLILPFF